VSPRLAADIAAAAAEVEAWTRDRDALIALGAYNGASQRELADATGGRLSPTTIRRIVATWKATARYRLAPDEETS
jgi:hypothetical protein